MSIFRRALIKAGFARRRLSGEFNFHDTRRLFVSLLSILIFSLKTKPVYADAALMGFTYTQDNVFITKAMGSDIVNIYLYGWGSYWPYRLEGDSSEYDDGKSIEQRIKMARDDGQQVMLTCATAPSIYRSSGTPWNMEERILPAMEDQYAQRCAQALERWPYISRVQVWNELKGYWIAAPDYRWDYEGYTRLYNKIYRLVKSSRPDVLVGGGYVVLDQGRGHDRSYGGNSVDTRDMDALRYWLSHADGYDAICIDALRKPQDFVKLTHYFRKITGGKHIWWSEYYGRTSEEMRQIREVFRLDLQPGDIALWWAERRFDWGNSP